MLKNVILSIFFIGIAITIYIGRNAEILLEDNRPKNMKYVRVKSESYFSDFALYLATNRSPKIYVKGPSMVIDHDLSEIYFSSPEGFFVRTDGENVRYAAAKGIFSKQQNRVELAKQVKFQGKNILFSGDKFIYSFNSEILQANGKIKGVLHQERTRDKISVSSGRLKGHLDKKLYYFSNNVRGVIRRKRQYEEPIRFSADFLSIYEQQGLLKLHKNVALHKSRIDVTAHDGKIYLENYNKKLKYYELSDDVKLKEIIPLRRGKTLVRKAYAEKLEGEMRRRRIVLTGFPKVIQSGSTLTGNVIVLKEKNKVIEVQDANSNFRTRE